MESKWKGERKVVAMIIFQTLALTQEEEE